MNVYHILVALAPWLEFYAYAGMVPNRERPVSSALNVVESGTFLDTTAVTWNHKTVDDSWKILLSDTPLNVESRDGNGQVDHLFPDKTHVLESERDSGIPLHAWSDKIVKNPSDSMVLAGIGVPILPYPSRRSTSILEGWALQLNEIEGIDRQEKFAYGPREVFFRVDTKNLIATGASMNCYPAQLILEDRLLEMVAKRDHHKRPGLEYYQKRSQLYLHASKVLAEFQRTVKISPVLTQAEKDLIYPLRFVSHFIVFEDKARDDASLKKSTDFWFFEEKLVGDYMKYVGIGDYYTSWINGPRKQDFTELAEPTELVLAIQSLTHWHFHKNQGTAVLSDLQGVGHVLTDPAMVDLNHEWDSDNTGLNGINGFIKTHKCNSWCTRLGLPKNLMYPASPLL